MLSTSLAMVCPSSDVENNCLFLPAWLEMPTTTTVTPALCEARLAHLKEVLCESNFVPGREDLRPQRIDLPPLANRIRRHHAAAALVLVP